MNPSIDFHEEERTYLRDHPSYALLYLREALKAIDEGETEVGTAMMRDVIASGVRFRVEKPRAHNPIRRASKREIVKA
jgi:hypothetical protein